MGLLKEPSPKLGPLDQAMDTVTAFIIPLLFLALWLLTSHTASTLPQLRGQRICLLIAHPDDEAMFFSPMLLALTKPELRNHIKILCLSEGKLTACPKRALAKLPCKHADHADGMVRTGNADGLGSVRREELLSSASLLGIRNPSSDVLILNSSDFPDSMNTTWPSETIANTLSSAFKITGASSPIDDLITFDAGGVSGHVNHISLYEGARHWLKDITKDRASYTCPVELYTLTSVPIWRKYISVFDSPYTLLKSVLINSLDMKRKTKKLGSRKAFIPKKMLFVSTPWDVFTGQKAMVKGHKSQMRWFRWGWIGVGRYMAVNDLRRETVR